MGSNAFFFSFGLAAGDDDRAIGKLVAWRWNVVGVRADSLELRNNELTACDGFSPAWRSICLEICAAIAPVVVPDAEFFSGIWHCGPERRREAAATFLNGSILRRAESKCASSHFESWAMRKSADKMAEIAAGHILVFQGTGHGRGTVGATDCRLRTKKSGLCAVVDWTMDADVRPGHGHFHGQVEADEQLRARRRTGRGLDMVHVQLWPAVADWMRPRT